MHTNPVFLRYLAIDAHKHYVVIGGVNAACELVLPPRRLVQVLSKSSCPALGC